ncbi:MAG: alpha/beta hydrolase [Burkholderiales bacterium]|nr:alpha/beta hydrolase [Burkholderiales bacterium]
MSTQALVFAHANGFTPGAYASLLNPLRTRFDVRAPALLPLRRQAMPSGDWAEIAADLASTVDAAPQPVVGVGHSLGAVALLMLAAQRPQRFSRLVLIEPVAMPAWACWLLRLAPAGVRERGPLARASRRREARWPGFDEAWAQARARRWFAGVADEVLHDVLSDGLQPAADGSLQLRFDPAWEARLYEQPVSLWPLLARPLPPMALLYGEHSRLFRAADAARWQRLRPQDTVQRFATAGHLLPLEQPQAVLASLRALLQAA